MESSVLKFKNVNFIVEKREKMFGGEVIQRNLLTDVTGTVKWGRKYNLFWFGMVVLKDLLDGCL